MKLSSHKPTMLTLNVLIFILAIAPSLISVNVLFPTRYGVRMINEEKLNYIMKKARSCVVAFLVPEVYEKIVETGYGKAAQRLAPSILWYAINCKENEELCKTQGITTYPTIKAYFQRQNEKKPVVYNSPINDWSEDALLWWIVANVPNPIAVIYPNEQAVRSWVSGCPSKLCAILFTGPNEVEFPTYWTIFGIKYDGRARLAVVHDDTRAIRMTMGRENIVFYHKDTAPPEQIAVAGSNSLEKVTKAFKLALERRPD